jgi:hypothetical protein
MFIGHFAVGFASKRVAPKTSLGLLVTAPLFLDLQRPLFLLFGWEPVRVDRGAATFTPYTFDTYPISHSLVTALAWAALFALVYWARTRYRAGAITLGLGVMSHWVLDALAHRPDLPLYPGGTAMVGFHLRDSVALAVAIESLMFVAGVALYLSFTRAKDRTGNAALWALVLFLALPFAAKAMSPAPPGPGTILWVSLVGWLVPLWAWELDRHRVVAEARAAPAAGD